MKEITLGQYYPSGSLIHRLDPRVKLLATLIYIVTLFICPKWQGVFISALWLVTIIRISKVPFLYMARQLKVVIVVLAIASVFNLFLTDGDQPAGLLLMLPVSLILNAYLRNAGHSRSVRMLGLILLLVLAVERVSRFI